MQSKQILWFVLLISVWIVCKAETITTSPSTTTSNSIHLTNNTKPIQTSTLETPVVSVESNSTNSSSYVEFFDTDLLRNNQSLSSDNTIQNGDKQPVKVVENNNSKKYKLKDPLQLNAQSQNPYLSGPPSARGGGQRGAGGGGAGGISPQLLSVLQNNPRLRQLAEQNPEITRQIMQNPRLLQDPRIQNLIRSQLGNGGGGAGLLGLLPAALGGLGGALNPLGIGLGGGGGQSGGPGGAGLGLGGQRSGQGGQQNNNGGLFGAPRGATRRPVNRNRNNEENIGGGYYGNNGNYGNNNDNKNKVNPRLNTVNTNNDGNDEANEENNGQEDDNAGQEGGGDEGQEEGDEGQEAGQDPNQDPSNDPDIQQLQNLGGLGGSDNFPEGLFPPGLLSRDDLNEIKKQQEKQAKEQAAKDKQQQAGQQGQDYDDGTGGEGGEGEGEGGEGEGEGEGEGGEGDGEVAEGEEGADEGAEDEGTTTAEPESGVTSSTPAAPPAYRQQTGQKYRPEFGGVRQSSVNQPGVEYDEILDENTPLVKPPTLNTISNTRVKSNRNNKVIPPPIPVPILPYNQQPQQPYAQPGIYPQNYSPQQQYGQPIQPYYPQPYQPQYGAPGQYPPQQQQPYPPQQYIPQQQSGQFIPNQPQVYPQYNQPGYPLPQQPAYGQYQPQNVRGQFANQNRRSPYDPNLANHNLNTVPHDDAEDTNEDYDANTGSGLRSGIQSGLRNRLGAQAGQGARRRTNSGGRSFQQQPRVFSSSAAHNTESSVAYNATQPTTTESNKFNQDNNMNPDKQSPFSRYGF